MLYLKERSWEREKGGEEKGLSEEESEKEAITNHR